MSDVIFDEEKHEYKTLDGKVLESVTTALRRFGLAKSYDGVPTYLVQRAAEKGKFVHKEIEEYVKRGDAGFAKELLWFIGYCAENNIKPLFAEVMVHNDCLAGTIDLIAEQDGKIILIDHKTAHSYDKPATQWQLSLYERLYGKPVYKRLVFHYLPERLEVEELQAIPETQVSRFIDAVRDGTDFSPETELDKQPFEIASRLLSAIEALEERKKAVEEDLKQWYSAVTEEMKKRGLKTVAIGSRRYTLVDETVQHSFDKKTFEAEHPELVARYQKTTNKAGYLKVTVVK